MGGKRSFDQRPKAAGPQVQRMSVTTAVLDSAMGGSKAGVLGVGKSTYATIRNTLAEYERLKASRKPGTEAKLVKLLEGLDRLCTEWINTHRGPLSPQDATRRTIFTHLSDELAAERASLSQTQAQDQYIGDLAAGMRPGPGAAPLVPGDRPHKFQAATMGTRGSAAQALDEFKFELKRAKDNYERYGNSADIIKAIEARMMLVREKKLTPAEHAAIIAYTEAGGDFEYINAATANSADWLTSLKDERLKKKQEETKKTGRVIKDWEDLPDQTLREEGSLHTAVAVAGLQKLDPYTGVSYRGQSYTEADFKKKIGVGKVATYSNLTSSSKYQHVARRFAGDNLKGDKDIAVLWAIEKGGGRDVEVLSGVTGEGEVLFLPGSAFFISSVVEVGTPGGEASAGKHADFYRFIADSGGLKAARRCYLVIAVPRPPRPATGPPAAKAAAPVTTRQSPTGLAAGVHPVYDLAAGRFDAPRRGKPPGSRP
jgi:hypothetical protein